MCRDETYRYFLHTIHSEIYMGVVWVKKFLFQTHEHMQKRTFVSNLSSTLLFQNNTREECQRSSWRTLTSRARRNWSDSCSMLAILNLRTFGLRVWSKSDTKEETTENTTWKLHQIRWGAPGFHFLTICQTPLLSGREISSLQLLLVRCSHNYRTTLLLYFGRCLHICLLWLVW